MQRRRVAVRGAGVTNADWTRSHVEITARTDELDIESDVVVLGAKVYYRGAYTDLPRGKTWVRSTDGGSDEPLLTPEEMLGLVKSAPGVARVGTEEVGGRPTTHLRAPLDAQRLDAIWKEQDLRETLATLVRDRDLGRTPVQATAEVWVDEDEHIARDRLVVRVKGVPGELRMATDYLESDVSLDDVKAPDPDTVIDEDDLPDG